MRRYFWREHQRTLRKAWLFCRENRQLLFLVGIICIGAVFGSLSYNRLSSEYRESFSFFIFDQQVPTSIGKTCIAVVSSAFYGWFLLILLFLIGLTAYGCPLILFVPLFFGFCLGISECHVYTSLGLWAMMKDVLILSIAVGIAVVFATGQALKMSCSFSRQLFPSHAHCGGLWQDFKTYLLYFCICLFIVLIGSVITVLLRFV